MATVNKDFKIKNGLVVEGSNATVNGNQILTETASDQYIIDLIGGETLVTSVESTQMEVINGELNIKTGVFDADGAAATAETNANTYTDTALEDYTPTASLDTTVGGYGYLKNADLPTMYSDSDVDAHLSGTNGITYSAGTISANVGNGITTGNINAVPHIIIDRDTVDGWYDASGAAQDVQDNLDDHTGASSNVHGVTGSVVGTSDVQVLTNKTINDELHFTNPSTQANDGGIVVNDVSEDFEITAYTANLHLKGQNDVTVTAVNGDIVLNADGTSYITSASAGNEIATHSYVDNAVSGLDWKNAVNTISFTNISLTGSTPLSIDSHTISDGYRVLLAGQSTGADNGIYDVAISGGSYTLTRSADADANDELKGAAVYVMEGNTYGATSWVQSNHYITNFANQDWTQFSGSGSVTAGSGITVDGLEVSIDRTTVDTWYDEAGAAGLVAGDLSDHESDTSTHGVTEIVGTDESQTLTNKTISGSSNTISNIGNSSLTNSSITINGNATSLGDSVTLYTDDVEENGGATNQYFTQTRARDSFSAGNAINYNSGTGEIAVDASQLDSDDIAEGTTNQYFTTSRAETAAINLLTGPAASLNNIQITTTGNGDITITAENGVADSDTDDLTEGSTNLYFTDQRALDAVANSTIYPNIVDINDYRREEATQQYVGSASTVTAHTFTGNRSVKYLVRTVGNVTGTLHSQITELLVTVDGGNNVAVTEYGTIHTSENALSTATVDYAGGEYRLRVTTAIAGAEVIAAATIMSWAD
jgi:hypothetical protein